MLPGKTAREPDSEKKPFAKVSFPREHIAKVAQLVEHDLAPKGKLKTALAREVISSVESS